MMTRFLLLSISLLCTFTTFAGIISQQQAEQVAKNFYFERFGNESSILIQDIGVSTTHTEQYSNELAFYFVEMLPSGFVIVAAEDKVYPILAYGQNSIDDYTSQPPAYKDWMQNRAFEVLVARSSSFVVDAEIQNMWKRLLQNGTQQLIPFNGKSLSPMLLCEWDQNANYNEDCPEDQFGPGGRAYAGCVAICMGQVMHYYKYPNQGTGSHSYYSSYGQLSASFGTTTYRWNEMVNEIKAHDNPAIAELLSHLGISVEMGYSAGGSGAYMTDATDALKDYFGYQSSTNLLQRYAYDDSTWTNMIKANLDANMPMLYAGYPSSGSGHAFNLDGYQGTDHFHFNWGWSGSYNAYYYVDNLNPGGSNFSNWQRAVFNMYPGDVNYPNGCSGATVLNTVEGSIYDGSSFMDYESNSSCTWLIQPSQNIDHLELSFDYLSTDPNDIIIVYDGPNASATVLDTLFGNTTPNKIISSGTSMYIKFISDNTIEMDGFHATYTSKFPIYCAGTTVLTDPSGTFDDGSTMNNYINNSFCKWIVQPTGNPQSIYFSFNRFETEDNQDVLQIIDIHNNSTIAQYSGSQIPPSLTVNSNRVMLMFTSNSEITAKGWEVSYYTNNASVNELVELDYVIFPNPAKDQLKVIIGSSQQDVQIRIYSITGQLVSSEKQDFISGEENEIDLVSIENGVYFIELISENFNIRQRFIKQ